LPTFLLLQLALLNRLRCRALQHEASKEQQAKNARQETIDGKQWARALIQTQWLAAQVISLSEQETWASIPKNE